MKTPEELSWESLNGFLSNLTEKYTDRVWFDIDTTPADNDGDYEYIWYVTLKNNYYNEKEPIESALRMKVVRGTEEDVYYVEMGEEWERVSQWDDSVINIFWMVMWDLWERINKLEEMK